MAQENLPDNIRQASVSTSDPASLFRRAFIKALVKFFFFFVMGGGLISGLFIISRGEAQKLSLIRGERQWITKSFDALAESNARQSEAGDLQKELEEGLPTTLDIPLVVIPKLQRIGEEKKVRVATQIGSAVPATDGEPPSLSVVIRADGTASDLIGFLNALEKGKMVFQFSAVDSSPLGKPPLFQAVLTGKLYLRQ